MALLVRLRAVAATTAPRALLGARTLRSKASSWSKQQKEQEAEETDADDYGPPPPPAPLPPPRKLTPTLSEYWEQRANISSSDRDSEGMEARQAGAEEELEEGQEGQVRAADDQQEHDEQQQEGEDGEQQEGEDGEQQEYDEDEQDEGEYDEEAKGGEDGPDDEEFDEDDISDGDDVAMRRPRAAETPEERQERLKYERDEYNALRAEAARGFMDPAHYDQNAREVRVGHMFSDALPGDGLSDRLRQHGLRAQTDVVAFKKLCAQDFEPVNVLRVINKPQAEFRRMARIPDDEVTASPGYIAAERALLSNHRVRHSQSTELLRFIYLSNKADMALKKLRAKSGKPAAPVAQPEPADKPPRWIDPPRRQERELDE